MSCLQSLTTTPLLVITMMAMIVVLTCLELHSWWLDPFRGPIKSYNDRISRISRSGTRAQSSPKTHPLSPARCKTKSHARGMQAGHRARRASEQLNKNFNFILGGVLSNSPSQHSENDMFKMLQLRVQSVGCRKWSLGF